MGLEPVPSLPRESRTPAVWVAYQASLGNTVAEAFSFFSLSRTCHISSPIKNQGKPLQFHVWNLQKLRVSMDTIRKLSNFRIKSDHLSGRTSQLALPRLRL